MLRVLMTSAEDSSGTYRIDMPAQAVKRRFGDDFQISIAGASSDPEMVLNKKGLPIRTLGDQYACLQESAFDFDLVVLQRPMYYFMPFAIREFHEHGIPVIIELDDDYHSPHSRNRAFMLNHPKTNPSYNWQHLSDCLKLADHVTVSTQPLAQRYGSHGRVSILRNCVIDGWLTVPQTSAERLGWPGTMVNHPTDPQQTCGAIPALLDEFPDWTFECIGGGGEHHDEMVNAFGLAAHADRVASTAWEPLELHPYLVTTIGVGVVPLWESAFNEAKSWLKGLEFAALGIPFVATGTTEYEALADEHGLGFLVRNQHKHWKRALASLMYMTSSERWELGEVYRRIVQNKLTMSGNAWRWAEVWADVAKRGVRNGR